MAVINEVYDFLKKCETYYLATLDQYPNLKAMYSATDDNTEVLYFESATATFSSFTCEPRTVNF